MGAVGAVTGVLVSSFFRQRPSGRDAMVNAASAATAVIVVGFFPAVLNRTHDFSSSGAPFLLLLLLIAVGSAIVRQVFAFRRRRT